MASCKKPLTEPEKVDPIYQELLTAADSAKKGVETEEKSLEELRKQAANTELTLGERRQLLKQIAVSDKKIRLMKQDKEFFALHAQSRKRFVREIYPKRFEKDLPWPDPEEIAQFEANKRLKGASRNWADRVPKLNYGTPIPTPAKQSGGGGH